MSQTAFDQLVDVYDAMVDWPSRLQYETPLLRYLVDSVPVRNVLDAACGTGRHAEWLLSWGLSVEAADVSGPMLDAGRRRVGPHAGIEWVQRSYDQPNDRGLRFDLILCIGNSLALAPDRTSAAAALRCMLAQLRPGGAFLMQVLNVQRLQQDVCTWQKCKTIDLDHRRLIVLKGVRRSTENASVEVVVVDPTVPTIVASHATPLLAFQPDELSDIVRDAGATDVTTYGNFDRQPFAPDQSPDLILVVRV